MKRKAGGGGRKKIIKNSRFPLFVLFFLASLFPLPASHALEPDDLVAGARIGGLGGAYAGHAEGYQSLYVNPAGLANMNMEGISSGLGLYYALPVSNYHFAYVRPVYAGITAAGGWQGTKSSLKNTDRFYLSWSQQEILPWIPKNEHRFSWGMSFRAISQISREDIASNFNNKLGVGLDAGVLLGFPRSGTQFGMSVTGLDSGNLHPPGPFLNTGVLQRRGPYALMIDYRIRPDFSTFYPAAEIELYHGLASVRIGRGDNLGALGTVALGFGVDLSPLTVDMALDLPYEGFHRSEGAAMVSVGYAFGGKRFYEKFVGRAATEAQNLSKELLNLEGRKRLALKEVDDAEFNSNILRAEIRAMEARRREEIGTTELRRAEAERRKEESAPKPKPRPQPPEWPKHHRASEGDTLRGIAGQYYGDPELWEPIYKTNPAKIIRGLPKVGEVLEIPKPEK
ncbi:MAG: hypothetical protein AAB091_05865 [Elusimicrobiota bacterium]